MTFGIKFPKEDKEAIEKLKKIEFLPFRVSSFDSFIEKKGIERGSTVLLAGGPGTGKTTFAVQSIYHGILAGEKAIYISFEENIGKIKRHMKASFGWDLEKLEKKGKMSIINIDPFKVARSVEAFLAEQKGDLLVKVDEVEFPFIPDRIVIDSLSALSIAFMGNQENYRYYIRYLFEMLEKYNSINYVISETALIPESYSRSGIEEFLADAVIVFYYILTDFKSQRQRALEILKLRCSAHDKRAIPFKIGKKGIEFSKTHLNVGKRSKH